MGGTGIVLASTGSGFSLPHHGQHWVAGDTNKKGAAFDPARTCLAICNNSRHLANLRGREESRMPHTRHAARQNVHHELQNEIASRKLQRLVLLGFGLL